ncbi:MAG: M14 family zinc carboxypeptidase [Kiritimatiellae bacterium]|nr:M14 family zinc carboxypeptidase [Kiritimatiellia bacterium]
MCILLHTGHEGANPQNAAAIRQTGRNVFTVLPWSEDGDSNYKFAFDVTVENPSVDTQQLDLTIDWAEPPEIGTRYMGCRRSVFLGEGEDWHEIRGRTVDDKTLVQVAVPPGRYRLCLHPPYGTPELHKFFRKATVIPKTRRVVFGRTAENRPLEALFVEPLARQWSTLLVVGRGHPYESAGTFCVEGVLDLLAGADGKEFRQHRAFVLVPIMNPDGVARGLCKRTTLGTDLTHEGREGTDPTARSLVGLVCGVAASPAPALWDVHGWMNAEDGLNFATRNMGARIMQLAGGDLFPRGWRNTEPARHEQSEDSPNFRRYAASTLGMDVLVTSHPFFGRNPETMRKVGAAVCRALLRALEE